MGKLSSIFDTHISKHKTLKDKIKNLLSVITNKNLQGQGKKQLKEILEIVTRITDNIKNLQTIINQIKSEYKEHTLHQQFLTEMDTLSKHSVYDTSSFKYTMRITDSRIDKNITTRMNMPKITNILEDLKKFETELYICIKQYSDDLSNIQGNDLAMTSLEIKKVHEQMKRLFDQQQQQLVKQQQQLVKQQQQPQQQQQQQQPHYTRQQHPPHYQQQSQHYPQQRYSTLPTQTDKTGFLGPNGYIIYKDGGRKKPSVKNPSKKKLSKKKSPKLHKGPRGGIYIIKKGKKIYQ
tara:strand:+ start:868 stop:1743 length:876 start_codon:yes stop_codon:yes gene_type:complete